MNIVKKIFLFVGLSVVLISCKDITQTSTLPFPLQNSQSKIIDKTDNVSVLYSFMKEPFDALITLDGTKTTEGDIVGNINVSIVNKKLQEETLNFDIGGLQLSKLSPLQYKYTTQDKESKIAFTQLFATNLSSSLNSNKAGNFKESLNMLPAIEVLKNTNGTISISKQTGFELSWKPIIDNEIGVIIELSQPFAKNATAPQYIVAPDNGNYKLNQEDLKSFLLDDGSEGNAVYENTLKVNIYRGNFRMITSPEGYKFKIIAYSKAHYQFKLK